MDPTDDKNLPSLDDLKGSGCITEEKAEKYAEVLASNTSEKPFDIFKAHRKATLGDVLPLMKKNLITEEERKEVQKIIDKIKALGFFSAGYIDNLIVYFEVLKNPLLSPEYLTEIVDKYIKPDVRVQGIRPFRKLAVGYFCNEIKKGGGSIRSSSIMMEECFLLSPSEVESANRSYKQVAEFIEKDEYAYFVVDFIVLMVLYNEEFLIEEFLHVFSPHHNAQAAKEKFLAAYDLYSQRIDKTYIPFIRDNFPTLPYLLDQILLPELKEYIAIFDPKKSQTHDINIKAGILLSYALLKVAPNLVNDKEKLKQLGWLEE